MTEIEKLRNDLVSMFDRFSADVARTMKVDHESVCNDIDTIASFCEQEIKKIGETVTRTYNGLRREIDGLKAKLEPKAKTAKKKTTAKRKTVKRKTNKRRKTR